MQGSTSGEHILAFCWSQICFREHVPGNSVSAAKVAEDHEDAVGGIKQVNAYSCATDCSEII